MLSTKEIAKILMERYNTPEPGQERNFTKINIAEAMEMAASFFDDPTCPPKARMHKYSFIQHLKYLEELGSESEK